MTWIIAKMLLGMSLVLFGYWDAQKYRDLTRKIKKAKTTKTHSRMFINKCFPIRFALIAHGIIMQDWYIVTMSVISLYYILEYWWAMYKHYSYHNYPKQKTITIKRPNIFTYIWNSLQPNHKRKHL